MRRLVFILFTIIGLCFLLQCKKGDHKIIISGYRATDEQGVPLPGVSSDTSDWHAGMMEAMPQEVLAAFDTIPLHISTNPPRGGNIGQGACTLAEAYPVPFTKIFLLGIYDCTSWSPCGSKYLIVDQDLHIYASGSLAGSGVKSISLESVNAGLYRVYYACYDSIGTIIWQGHGDVLKN